MLLPILGKRSSNLSYLTASDRFCWSKSSGFKRSTAALKATSEATEPLSIPRLSHLSPNYFLERFTLFLIGNMKTQDIFVNSFFQLLLYSSTVIYIVSVIIRGTYVSRLLTKILNHLVIIRTTCPP